jgi:transposase
MIVIGLDPHKSSHTAVAVDLAGAVLGSLQVASDKSAVARLIRWARPWPQRRWAVEGARGLGHLIAQQLVAAGEPVVDVPAKLAARARLLDSGHGRKTDGLDAVSIALTAQRRTDLPAVAAEDHTAVLRMLSDRRDDLNQERRRVVNRLHRILRDLVNGGAPRELSAATAATMLSRLRPVTTADHYRKDTARDLVADIRRLDRALAANRRDCAQATAAAGTHLTAILGISDVLAVKILGHTGDITRFHDADHFASYTGTAPLEASSGSITRHRLSRAGNRQLNHALYLAAHVQTLHPGPGRDYYQRKIAEAKTSAEALRCLKRQLAKIIYRQLREDHNTHLTHAA